MPRYDYYCPKCETILEIIHTMADSTPKKCSKCSKIMQKMISGSFSIIGGGLRPTISEHKELEHTKKVKDLDRAVRKRKSLFGSDAVGTPVDKPNPKHIVKKGRVLGGQEKEVDKKEFIKALAKDDLAVAKATEIVKKSKK